MVASIQNDAEIFRKELMKAIQVYHNLQSRRNKDKSIDLKMGLNRKASRTPSEVAKDEEEMNYLLQAQMPALREKAAILGLDFSKETDSVMKVITSGDR